MAERPETLPARIAAALASGAATAVLTSLYFELSGETCYQRPRLLHFLGLSSGAGAAAPVVVPSPSPNSSPTLMAYKFKAAFADVSAIVHYAKTGPKEVTAANLTPEDAERLIADNRGHLLEKVTGPEAVAAAKAAKPELSTRTVEKGQPAEPVLVPLMVAVAGSDGPSDVEVHDEAEKAAAAKAEDAADNAPDEAALKVEVVAKPKAAAKPHADHAAKAKPDKAD